MLKKFFSSKKNKEEEKIRAPERENPSVSGKIVIKKRTPSKRPTNFVPTTEAYVPEETSYSPQEYVQEAPVEEVSNIANEPHVSQVAAEPEYAQDINELEYKLGTLDAEKEHLSSELEISQKLVQDMRLQLAEANRANQELLLQIEQQAAQPVVEPVADVDHQVIIEGLETELAEKARILDLLGKERDGALSELEDLKLKNTEVLKKVEELKGSKKAVSNDIQEAEAEVEILQAMVNRLEAEQEEVEQQGRQVVEEMEMNIASLEEQLRLYKEKENNLDDAYVKLNNEKAALEKQEIASQSKIDNQKIKIDELEAEKSELLKSLQDTETGKEGDQSALEITQKELDKRKEDIDKLGASVKELRAQLKAEQQSVASAQEGQRKLEKEIASKVEEVEKEQKNTARAEKKTTDLQEEKSKIAETVRNLELEVKKLATYEKQIDKQLVLIGEKEKEIGKIKGALEQSELAQVKYGKDSEKLRSKIGMLEEEKIKMLKTINQLGSNEAKISEQLENEKAIVQSLKDEVKVLTDENKKQTAEIAKLVAEGVSKNNEAEKEIKGLSIAKDKVAAEMTKLQLEQKDSQGTIVTLTKELGKLQAENADHKLEVAKLNKQLIQTATKLAAASVVQIEEESAAEARLTSQNKQDLESSKFEPKTEVSKAPEPSESTLTVKEVEEDVVLTINVSIMPQGDEFELELPSDITGMNIISELIDAEVLHEEMNFAINLKRTGSAIGGDDTLKGMGVRDGDLIVIDTE